MQCHLHFVNSFSNFVNRERVCSPGDNVKVTVDLNFKAATKIEEIHINVIGTAKTKFIKKFPNGTTKLVSGTSELLNKKVEIIRDTNLTTGNHKFRSSFTLPSNIPSSFKFSNSSKNKITRWRKTGCTIKYKVQVIVHRTGSPLKKYDFPFDVIKPIDLNDYQPSLRKSREIRTTISNGISGDFSMNASIPQRGYVPGENITVNVNVNNLSQVNVRGVEVSLIKKIILTRYNFHHKPILIPFNSNDFLDHLSLLGKNNKEAINDKEEEEWIITESTVECDEVPAGDSREFRRVLKVPPLQPVIENCELIQVCYRLWIKARADDGRRETLVLPLVIGTVPLRNGQGVPESQVEHKNEPPKLKLIIPAPIQDEGDSTTCRCTCPCPHCSKVKIVTTASGSPEPFDPQMVPQTPMSPEISPFDIPSTSKAIPTPTTEVAA